jgi:hypothetical protein
VLSFGKVAVETVFTAFVVPALLIPLLWLGRTVVSAFRHAPRFRFEDRFRLLERAYVILSSLLLAGGILSWAGVPVEIGGRPLTILAWIMYAAANLLFAGIVLGMTTSYASLPDGRTKDALFLRFVGEVSFQAVMTAGAFLLLFRLLRVVYHQKFPGLDVVTEGI